MLLTKIWGVECVHTKFEVSGSGSMANMQNSAHQAKYCALKILSQTEKYVTGVSENGNKLFIISMKK